MTCSSRSWARKQSLLRRRTSGLWLSLHKMSWIKPSAWVRTYWRLLLASKLIFRAKPIPSAAVRVQTYKGQCYCVIVKMSFWPISSLHCKDKIPRILNKNSQKRNYAASIPISTSCVCERFISHDRSAYYAAGKCVDRSWEYINRSQTHELGNWDWGRAIPFLGPHKWALLAVWYRLRLEQYHEIAKMRNDLTGT